MDARVPVAALEDAFALPATVTRPGEAAIVTKGIWLRSLIEDPPVGHDYNRREPRRLMAFRRDVVPDIPRGTLIVAAEKIGEASRDWQVDGLEASDGDFFRVVLVPQTAI